MKIYLALGKQNIPLFIGQDSHWIWSIQIMPVKVTSKNVLSPSMFLFKTNFFAFKVHFHSRSLEIQGVGFLWFILLNSSPGRLYQLQCFGGLNVCWPEGHVDVVLFLYRQVCSTVIMSSEKKINNVYLVHCFYCLKI